MKIVLLMTAAVVLTLGAACGTPATPTADPVQIQASAVAAASTMVAMTEQAAPPTPTLEPPTPLPSPTELPSPTPAELPTLEFQVPTIEAAPTTADNGAGGDPCNAPLVLSPGSPRVTANINNTTNGEVRLSLYLQKNDFGECGYRGLVLGAHDSAGVSDLPKGCYWAGAFVTDPKQDTKSFGSFCLTNGDHFKIEVRTDLILLK